MPSAGGDFKDRRVYYSTTGSHMCGMDGNRTRDRCCHTAIRLTIESFYQLSHHPAAAGENLSGRGDSLHW
jgi:hypothetical protein